MGYIGNRIENKRERYIKIIKRKMKMEEQGGRMLKKKDIMYLLFFRGRRLKENEETKK